MDLSSWSLERPLALSLLLLPLGLWLWLRRPREPRVALTSQLHVWRQLAEQLPREASSRSRGLPPRARWLLAALGCAALAAAGPGRRDAAGLEPVRVLVDRSPSMFLEHPSGGSRLEVALERALELLDGVAPTERLWSTPGEEPAMGAAPPAAWLTAPPSVRRSPTPAEAAGALLVTDLWQEHEGGQVASGGSPVPGVVGEAEGRTLVWDGELVAPGTELRPRTVAVSAQLPGELRTLLELWVEERGHELTPPGRPADLELTLAPGPATPGQLSGAGWTLSGQLVQAGSGEGSPGVGLAALVVSPGPGRLEVRLHRIDQLSGDPAGFAVAWGQLLDESLPPRAGVVSVEERLAAGEARSAPPELVPLRTRPRGPDPAAWLALAALLLAVVALAPWTLPSLEGADLRS